MKVEWRYYNDKGVVGGAGDLGKRSGTLRIHYGYQRLFL